MSAEGAKRTKYANLSGKRTEYGISVFTYSLRMSAKTEYLTELDVTWKSMERSAFIISASPSRLS